MRQKITHNELIELRHRITEREKSEDERYRHLVDCSFGNRDRFLYTLIIDKS